MRRIRNPRYAPEFLERKLSPSGFPVEPPPAEVSPVDSAATDPQVVMVADPGDAVAPPGPLSEATADAVASPPPLPGPDDAGIDGVAIPPEIEPPGPAEADPYDVAVPPEIEPPPPTDPAAEEPPIPPELEPSSPADSDPTDPEAPPPGGEPGDPPPVDPTPPPDPSGPAT
jgi:hypothetical protein